MAMDSSTTMVVMAGGGLMIGAIAGRIPMSAATQAGRSGFGFFSMLACMAAGLLCGGIGAFVLAYILRYWIREMGPVGHEANYGDPARGGPDMRQAFRPGIGEPGAGPFTAIGPVIVCNRCRHSGSRGKDGNPPAECASCGAKFTQGAKRHPIEARIRGEEDLVELRLAYPERRR